MGIKNKFFTFIKPKSGCRCVTGGQLKSLLSAMLLLIFFSVSITVLSQEKNIPQSPVVLKEDSSVRPETSLQADTGNKMGFADFLVIYHSYSQTKIEDERLKEAGRELQEKIDADRNKIVELEKKMNSGILSEQEMGNLRKEVEELKTQVTKNIQEFNLKIESDRRQVIDKLVEELKGKISDYGKEKGYVMILDQNQLIFSDTRLDITQEIINYVNKNNKE